MANPAYRLFCRCPLLYPAPDDIPFFRCHIGLIILGHCFGDDNPLHDQVFLINISWVYHTLLHWAALYIHHLLVWKNDN